eukprot:COSAG03_NODE_4439_length_1554_cov_3.078351_1_plen_40_part_10
MDLDEAVPQDEKLRLSHLCHRLACDEVSLSLSLSLCPRAP